jgi:hypothetical protein
MSTVTREFYNAIEVSIEEFSDEAIRDEAIKRGLRVADEDDLVVPAQVLHQWGRMLLSGQYGLVAQEALDEVRKAVRQVA